MVARGVTCGDAAGVVSSPGTRGGALPFAERGFAWQSLFRMGLRTRNAQLGEVVGRRMPPARGPFGEGPQQPGAVVDNGLAASLGRLVPTGTTFAALLLTAVLAAVVANLINNLPAVLVLVPLAVPSGPGAVLAVAALWASLRAF